jgi:Family of unknown function (DUF6084)
MQAAASAPALRFRPLGAEAARGYAMPTIELIVEIDAEAGYEIRTITLNAEVRIAAQRRQYGANERERLLEVFGDASQWAQSMRSLQWMRGSLNVPRFAGSTQVRIPLPCTFDFDVVASKYLIALETGEIPVDVLFTGTVFYCGSDGGLQTAMIPWESEVSFRIPVSTWRQAVDAAFPESAWIRMRRDTLKRLQAYRSRHVHADWDQMFDELLTKAEEH